MTRMTQKQHPFDPRQGELSGGLCFRCQRAEAEHPQVEIRRNGSRFDVIWMGELIGQVQGTGTRWVFYRKGSQRWSGYSVRSRRVAIEHLIGL